MIDIRLVGIGHVAADRRSVQRLPSILLVTALNLTMRTDLHHSIDEGLVVLVLSVSVVLRGASGH